MREVGRALGVVPGIVGVVSNLQRFDFHFAPQSFMTGDRIWVIWGVVAVLVGSNVMWKGRSRGVVPQSLADIG